MEPSLRRWLVFLLYLLVWVLALGFLRHILPYVFLSTMIGCICCLLQMAREARRSSSARTSAFPRRLCSVDPDTSEKRDENKLYIVMVIEGGLRLPDSSPKECSICLDEFDDGGDAVAVLSCRHKYHWECITKWFTRSSTCPLCMREVM